MSRSSKVTGAATNALRHMMNVGTRVWWGIGGFLLGAGLTLVFSWFAFMAPLRESVAAQQAAARQWAEFNRQERQAIQDVKNVSVEEMRRWVAAVTEQNTRFAELQRKLHGQEMELADGGTSYLVIVAIVVLGSVLLTAYMVRDKNTASDVTLENIAALTPTQMVTIARKYVGEHALPPKEVSGVLPNSHNGGTDGERR